MSKYAYINTVPDSIKFSLPYSDNEHSERLVVKIENKKTDVIVKQGSDYVLIPVEDIDWLRQALDDIKSIIKMNEPEKIKTNE